MLSDKSIEFVFLNGILKKQLISHVGLHHHDLLLLLLHLLLI